MARIDVHDGTGSGAPIIGTAELILPFFKETGTQRWIEIFFDGKPAGRLQFLSEFVKVESGYMSA